MCVVIEVYGQLPLNGGQFQTEKARLLGENDWAVVALAVCGANIRDAAQGNSEADNICGAEVHGPDPRDLCIVVGQVGLLVPNV
jgi:hypothetical protein